MDTYRPAIYTGIVYAMLGAGCVGCTYTSQPRRVRNPPPSKSRLKLLRLASGAASVSPADGERLSANRCVTHRMRNSARLSLPLGFVISGRGGRPGRARGSESIRPLRRAGELAFSGNPDFSVIARTPATLAPAKLPSPPLRSHTSAPALPPTPSGATGLSTMSWPARRAYVVNESTAR